MYAFAPALGNDLRDRYRKFHGRAARQRSDRRLDAPGRPIAVGSRGRTLTEVPLESFRASSHYTFAADAHDFDLSNFTDLALISYGTAAPSRLPT